MEINFDKPNKIHVNNMVDSNFIFKNRDFFAYVEKWWYRISKTLENKFNSTAVS